MCDCGKGNDCGCIKVGPIGPQGPAGPTGPRGIDGFSVIASFISDGVTPIGNTVYPLNTLVFQLSNLIYIPSGIIYSAVPPQALEWNDLTIINGWVADTGLNTPQYAISNGLVYFRGRVNLSGASSPVFTQISTLGLSGNVFSSVGTDLFPGGSLLMFINSSGDIEVSGYASPGVGSRILLDSIAPISIR